MKLKLAQKLFLTTLILLALTLIVQIVTTSIKTGNIIKSNLIEELSAISKERGKQVDKKIEDLHRLSQSIADNEFVYDFFISAKKGNIDNNQKAKITDHLTKLVQLYNPMFENIFYTFDGKAFIDGINGNSVGYDFDLQEAQDIEWYLTTMATKKPYVGKIMQSPISGYPIIVSSFPIIDKNDEILSVFSLPINLNGFSSDIVKSSDNDAFKTIVINNDGDIIAAEDTSKIYNFNLKEANNSLNELYQKITKNNTGVEYFQLDSVESIGVFQKINNNLITITYTPKSTYLDAIKASIYNLLFYSIVFLFISMVIAYFLARRITNPILKVINLVNRMSNGDLTGKSNYKSTDEIGELSIAYNNMIRNVRNIVETIIINSEQIAGASNQLKGTSEQMAEGASEQASSVEEVSSTMEEISLNISQNSENSLITESISNKAVKGVERLVQASKDSLESIHNISQKITVINDIAFQTNILALNAAVEAARSGEHGRGFAVVASEVRNLAERCKLAADEIIKLSQNSVKLTEISSGQLVELLPDIIKTSQLIQEISSSSEEQKNGADQVNDAMQQLNMITQQNASSSEELAASSVELANQSEALKDVITFFKLSNHHDDNKTEKSGNSEPIPKRKDEIKNNGITLDVSIEKDMNLSEFEKY